MLEFGLNAATSSRAKTRSGCRSSRLSSGARSMAVTLYFLAEQLRCHAAGAGTEFQPVAAFAQRLAVHQKVVQRLGDFRTGAADGVRGVLADVFRAARIEAVRGFRALHAAEQAFFADEAEQGGQIAVLGFDVFELRDLLGKKLERPAAQVGGERLVVAVRRARIELADEDRLGIASRRISGPALAPPFRRSPPFSRDCTATRARPADSSG